MSDFFVALSSAAGRDGGDRIFRVGIAMAGVFKKQTPQGILSTDWAWATVFHRGNGSGSSVETDPETGSWILANGTWFHSDGATAWVLTISIGSGPSCPITRREFFPRLPGWCPSVFPGESGTENTRSGSGFGGTRRSWNCFRRDACGYAG